MFDVVKDICLTIEYSYELPDNCGGFLERSNEPRVIFINANHPQFEQTFTIAHEVAHYLIHHNRPPRKHSFWYIDRQWRSARLDKASRTMRRMFSRIVNSEFEADLWAFCLLWELGDIETLKAHWHHHPKHRLWIFIACVTATYHALPKLPFLWLKILFHVEITP